MVRTPEGDQGRPGYEGPQFGERGPSKSEANHRQTLVQKLWNALDRERQSLLWDELTNEETMHLVESFPAPPEQEVRLVVGNAWSQAGKVFFGPEEPSTELSGANMSKGPMATPVFKSPSCRSGPGSRQSLVSRQLLFEHVLACHDEFVCATRLTAMAYRPIHDIN